MPIDYGNQIWKRNNLRVKYIKQRDRKELKIISKNIFKLIGGKYYVFKHLLSFSPDRLCETIIFIIKNDIFLSVPKIEHNVWKFLNNYQIINKTKTQTCSIKITFYSLYILGIF